MEYTYVLENMIMDIYSLLSEDSQLYVKKFPLWSRNVLVALLNHFYIHVCNGTLYIVLLSSVQLIRAFKFLKLISI